MMFPPPQVAKWSMRQMPHAHTVRRVNKLMSCTAVVDKKDECSNEQRPNWVISSVLEIARGDCDTAKKEAYPAARLV